MTPLVTFEHARGDATICNKKKNRKKAQCKLPTRQAVRAKAIKAFKARFPTVRNVVPWNEVNHFTQPTYKNPKAAAKFTKIARKVFKGGTVRGRRHARPGQQHDAPRSRSSRRRSRTPRGSARRSGGQRKICGIHNYSDINRFRTTGTKALMKASAASSTGSPRWAASTSSRASRRPRSAS